MSEAQTRGRNHLLAVTLPSRLLRTWKLSSWTSFSWRIHHHWPCIHPPEEARHRRDAGGRGTSSWPWSWRPWWPYSRRGGHSGWCSSSWAAGALPCRWGRWWPGWPCCPARAGECTAPTTETQSATHRSPARRSGVSRTAGDGNRSPRSRKVLSILATEINPTFLRFLQLGNGLTSLQRESFISHWLLGIRTFL